MISKFFAKTALSITVAATGGCSAGPRAGLPGDVAAADTNNANPNETTLRSGDVGVNTARPTQQEAHSNEWVSGVYPLKSQDNRYTLGPSENGWVVTGPGYPDAGQTFMPKNDAYVQNTSRWELLPNADFFVFAAFSASATQNPPLADTESGQPDPPPGAPVPDAFIKIQNDGNVVVCLAGSAARTAGDTPCPSPVRDFWHHCPGGCKPTTEPPDPPDPSPPARAYTSEPSCESGKDWDYYSEMCVSKPEPLCQDWHGCNP